MVMVVMVVGGCGAVSNSIRLEIFRRFHEFVTQDSLEKIDDFQKPPTPVEIFSEILNLKLCSTKNFSTFCLFVLDIIKCHGNFSCEKDPV